MMILVVDDEIYMRDSIASILQDEGYQVAGATNADEALRELEKKKYDLVLTDHRMPGRMNGMDLLQEIRRQDCEIQVLMMTAYGSVDQAVEAMRNGAFDYLQKPFQPEELRIRIRKGVEEIQRRREMDVLKAESGQKKYDMIGVSSVWREIQANIREIAQTQFPVLITGESGTGKELVARQIHLQSPRRDKPFVAINVSTLNPNLVESELFGHEKGAFTGAVVRRIGKFELASEGTLFLDEIGELSPDIQTKLLRVLQEKEFNRVGGNQLLTTSVRIVAATLKNLQIRIQENAFREDLYYRLNVYPIHVPPLRDRPEDIPILTEHFVAKYGPELNKRIEKIEPELFTYLAHYGWPGNVRELENAVIRMLIKSHHPDLTVDDLPADLRNDPNLGELVKMPIIGTIDILLDQAKQKAGENPIMDYIETLLAQRMFHRIGEKKKAADELGISKPTFFKWYRRDI